MHQSGDVACMHAGIEYIGVGSNRNFCFTDLLLHERCTTDIARLSAANWGTIEVKGIGNSVCLKTCLWQKPLLMLTIGRRFCQLCSR